MTAEHAHTLGAISPEYAEAAGGEGVAFVKRLIGAWDCCGTCAGGVIATRDAATRQAAADTVLAAARRICCGDNPAPHHAATDAHSTRMAFAEELARAVRG